MVPFEGYLPFCLRENKHIISREEFLQSWGNMTLCVVSLNFLFSWKPPASCYPDAPSTDCSAVAWKLAASRFPFWNPKSCFNWQICPLGNFPKTAGLPACLIATHLHPKQSGKLHRLKKAKQHHFLHLFPFPLMFINIRAEMWQWEVLICTRRGARSSEHSQFNIVPTK